jgi:hypothetical protein
MAPELFDRFQTLILVALGWIHFNTALAISALGIWFAVLRLPALFLKLQVRDLRCGRFFEVEEEIFRAKFEGTYGN